MVKPALTYGVLTGVALMLLTFIIYLAGQVTNTYVNYLAYLVVVLGIVVGTRAFRDEYRGGFINYGQALGFGTLTVFFAAVIAGIFSFFFYSYIAPDAYEQIKQATEVGILETNPNISDRELDLAMMFISPVMLMITTILSYTFVGFVVSLITSLFLKRKDPLEI